MGSPTRRYATTAHQLIETFNRGDHAGHAGLYAQDAKYIESYFPEPIVGPEGMEQVTRAMAAAFPDMQWTIVSLLEDGDRVACEVNIKGTHSGPLSTPGGEVPATGRAVSWETMSVIEFDEDGLISEHRTYMDPGTVMGQLGLA